MPERVGSKVLPIPTKTRLFLRGQPKAVGEQQEPPRIYGGEVSDQQVDRHLCRAITRGKRDSDDMMGRSVAPREDHGGADGRGL